jgi:hypothetical protein
MPGRITFRCRRLGHAWEADNAGAVSHRAVRDPSSAERELEADDLAK